MKCNGDSCEINEEDATKLKHMAQGLSGEQLMKLRNWLGMEPMDYDAPGSRTREQEGLT